MLGEADAGDDDRNDDECGERVDGDRTVGECGDEPSDEPPKRLVWVCGRDRIDVVEWCVWSSSLVMMLYDDEPPAWYLDEGEEPEEPGAEL